MSDSVILWTVACQAPLSMIFPWKEYWSGLPPPGDLPDPGIEPTFLMSPALAVGFFTSCATWETDTHVCVCVCVYVYVYMCIYIYRLICSLYKLIYRLLYIYVYIHTHTHTHLHFFCCLFFLFFIFIYLFFY